MKRKTSERGGKRGGERERERAMRTGVAVHSMIAIGLDLHSLRNDNSMLALSMQSVHHIQKIILCKTCHLSFVSIYHHGICMYEHCRD